LHETVALAARLRRGTPFDALDPGSGEGDADIAHQAFRQ
jgi:hypothetical protein